MEKIPQSQFPWGGRETDHNQKCYQKRQKQKLIKFHVIIDVLKKFHQKIVQTLVKSEKTKGTNNYGKIKQEKITLD